MAHGFTPLEAKPVGDKPRTISMIKLHIFYKMIENHFEYWADINYKKNSIVTLTEISQQSNAHKILFEKMVTWFEAGGEKSDLEKPNRPKFIQ